MNPNFFFLKVDCVLGAFLIFEGELKTPPFPNPFLIFDPLGKMELLL